MKGAMSVVAFDDVPCWSTKSAQKQDEEPTKKSDSEGTQKEPKTAKKQDEEVLCCSYETCCTCGQEGLRREDAAAECRICGHLACTNWCILWRDRLGVLCRCCLRAQFDSIDGFCQGPDAVRSMERPEVAIRTDIHSATSESPRIVEKVSTALSSLSSIEDSKLDFSEEALEKEFGTGSSGKIWTRFGWKMLLAAVVSAVAFGRIRHGSVKMLVSMLLATRSAALERLRAWVTTQMADGWTMWHEYDEVVVE